MNHQPLHPVALTDTIDIGGRPRGVFIIGIPGPDGMSKLVVVEGVCSVMTHPPTSIISGFDLISGGADLIQAGAIMAKLREMEDNNFPEPTLHERLLALENKTPLRG